MNDSKIEKKYYYVNILDEANYVFLAPSWDAVFMFLINYYNGTGERDQRILKDINELSDKIYVFKRLTDTNIDFISVLDKPLFYDSDCIKELDIDGDEIR